MGKKSQPTPPPAPDPTVVANAQGTANKDTAIANARLNAVNSYSPFGNVTYSESPSPGDPSVPQFTQNTTFSPDQQRLFDTQGRVEQQAYDTAATGIGNAQSVLNSPFSLSGLPALQTGGGTPLFGISGKLPNVPLSADDFAAQGKATTDALMSRFNEDFGQQQESTISRLNAEGNQRGSEGFDTAMKGLDRSRNDALAQALLAGNQEQNTLFNQALASRGQATGEQAQDFSQRFQNASFGNQARQQAISEAQLQRSQPINEIATLLGLGSGIQTPNAAPNFGINIGNTDVLGAYGLQQQAQQNAYNQKMQSNNALWGALGNMAGAAGSAAIFASDRRVKNVVGKVGRTPNGTPLYLYAYKDKPETRIVGVMAQDMMRIAPMAVHSIGNVLHVDYGMIR
jgi:hypothetical protein